MRNDLGGQEGHAQTTLLLVDWSEITSVPSFTSTATASQPAKHAEAARRQQGLSIDTPTSKNTSSRAIWLNKRSYYCREVYKQLPLAKQNSTPVSTHPVPLPASTPWPHKRKRRVLVKLAVVIHLSGSGSSSSSSSSRSSSSNNNNKE
ncbi:hypothetical protein E2C01_087069 [Portunus trituberculatus]|uniref:Uncharacterized protein n=1 Tax=Portunus trituberculatus TaxID=210409 RepID=A0A5B7J2F2_PORTR|nr:hypothetical protein [Portunus trituberculatus]